MKARTPEMIEGPEAFMRFGEAAKKLFTTLKSAAANPFGKAKQKKKRHPEATK
jgi:hypothetical protein